MNQNIETMRSIVMALFVVTAITASCTATMKEDKATEPTTEVGTGQSDETMKTAMAFMEAMGKGDMDKMTSLMHDDMVWQNEGDQSMPWIGPWEGKKAILEKFMPLFGENFQTRKWEPEDSFASGDTAAFLDA